MNKDAGINKMVQVKSGGGRITNVPVNIEAMEEEQEDLESGSLASEEYQSKAEVVEGCRVVEDLADVRRGECVSRWLDPGRRRRC